jgi:dephospho-CoA kinase
MRVGLTGGVGSGKSTVAALLAEHGAMVVDADAIAREVVAPGTPGLAAVLERFGPGVAAPDGSLDRTALAAVVFGDDAARADLNAIVHPLVRARSAELTADVPAGAIVVHDIPLLVEADLAGGFDVVVVVEADPQTRLRRLERRGLAPADARARMATQATDEQRRAVAHEIVANDGDRAALRAEVDELWRRLRRRQEGMAEAAT